MYFGDESAILHSHATSSLYKFNLIPPFGSATYLHFTSPHFTSPHIHYTPVANSLHLRLAVTFYVSSGARLVVLRHVCLTALLNLEEDGHCRSDLLNTGLQGSRPAEDTKKPSFANPQ